MRQIVPALAKHAVLLRSKKMHDSVDQLKDVIGNFRGLFVDVGNTRAAHVDIINQQTPGAKPCFTCVGSKVPDEVDRQASQRAA
jgi:hypothetical protein